MIDHVVPDKARLRTLRGDESVADNGLSPVIGYDKASAIGKKLSLDYSIRDALREIRIHTTKR